MGVWGLEAEIAVLAFVLVAPLGLLPAVHAIYRRFGALRLLPSVVLAGATLYGLALVAFTLFPIPADAADACTRTAAGWRLSPFASVRDAAQVAREVGAAAFLTSGSFLQLAMNVVLLVPLGVLVGLAGRRPWWQAVLAGLAASSFIELSQGTGVWGIYDCPYRLAEVDDLLTNTSGALLGWALGRWLAPRLRWPQRGWPGVEASVGRRVAASFCDLVAIVLAAFFVQVCVLAVTSAATGDVDAGTWPWWWRWVLGSLAPVGIVSLALPAWRGDRASVGQRATLLHPVDARGLPPTLRALAVRSVVRWWPVLVAGLGSVAVVALPIGFLAQAAVVSARRDHRSWAWMASGVRLVGDREPAGDRSLGRGWAAPV